MMADSNPAVERALRLGLESVDEAPTSHVEVPLSAKQEDKLDQLCDVLGLSVRAVLNAAVQYLLFHASIVGTKPADLYLSSSEQGMVKRMRFEPNIEIDQRLRDVNLQEHTSKCAVAGLELLHAKLIPEKQQAA